ncbi:MAG TPA: SDR family oxidoreductase [Candidatus Udaeobacter sp.]|nr:SDR family oxidoreductase [Candidatus Udaeobacter sp.]
MMTGLRIPDLEGKIYLVTGASTGIGAAVARAFGAQGAAVGVGFNASAKEAEAVAAEVTKAGGKALPVPGDMMKQAEVARAVERTAKHFGRLDGLINNAGGMLGRMALADSDEAHDRAVMDLNSLSVVWASRAALPWLKARGGVIIHTSSVAARNGGGPGATLYAASKGFVSTLTRGMAKELVKDRIRVNAVAPGLIQTPFHDRYSTPEQIKVIAASIPMGRAGTPEDCAGAYLFLASDMLSGYMTGQVIEVNGGQLMP